MASSSFQTATILGSGTNLHASSMWYMVLFHHIWGKQGVLCTLREQPVTSRLNERVNPTPFFGVLLTTWCHCARLPSRFRKVVGTIHALRCGR